MPRQASSGKPSSRASWGPAVWKIATQLQARKSTQLVNGLYNPGPEQRSETRGNLFNHCGWTWSQEHVPITHRSLGKRMGQVCLHLSHPPPHAMLPRCRGLPSPPQLESRKSCRWVYIPARYQGLQGHPLQSQAHTRHSMHSWEMDFTANSEMENHS